MLVGARNKIAKENERNRKQTVQLKEEEAERERDAVFFSHEIYFRPQVTLDVDANSIEGLDRKLEEQEEQNNDYQ